MDIGRVSGWPPSPPVDGSVARAGSGTAGPTRHFVEILGEGARSRAEPAAPAMPKPSQVAEAGRAPGAATTGALRGILQDTLDAESRIDAVLRAASAGKTFTPGELLALQTQVFRYSQAVEVISRAADKVVGAIKQTLGTQV